MSDKAIITRDWMDGISSSINTFMFLSPPSEKSLEDIYNTPHKELLNEVTEYFCKKPGGFGPKGFKILMERCFEKYQLNKINKGIHLFSMMETNEHIWSMLKTMDYNRDTAAAKKRKKKDAEVYTPVELIDKMLDKLPLETWTNPEIRFLDPACGRGVFLLRIKEKLMKNLKEIINEEAREKHIIENMLFGWDMRSLQTKIAERAINFKGKFKTNIEQKDSLMSEYKGRKFDVVIGNPPYQKMAPNREGATGAVGRIWDKFVKMAIDNLCKEGGYISFIHPGAWRMPEHRLWPLLTSRQIEYLELHSQKEGVETFGAVTNYDWYVMKNVPYKNKTIVIDYEKTKKEVDLKNVNFLPNIFGINFLKSNTELNKSKRYRGLDGLKLEEKPKGNKTIPVIASVLKDMKLKIRFIDEESAKKAGLGKPKIIRNLGADCKSVLVDYEGKYAVSNNVFVIEANSKKELKLIEQKMKELNHKTFHFSGMMVEWKSYKYVDFKN